jgi:hypothetical protein
VSSENAVAADRGRVADLADDAAARDRVLAMARSWRAAAWRAAAGLTPREGAEARADEMPPAPARETSSP